MAHPQRTPLQNNKGRLELDALSPILPIDGQD